MTTYKDLLIDNLNRAYERFERAFNGVTIEETDRFPVANQAPQIKSMTWLAWHTARELDFQIADLADEKPIWHIQNWKAEFLFTIADDVQDWAHSLSEACLIQSDNREALFGYLKAATIAAINYVETLTESSLDDIVDNNWTPAVTRGVRLVSIINDASMQSGQVFYSRRLLGLVN